MGGGGVMIPTAMLFFRFDTDHAIAMSNVSIFFSALARFLMNLGKPHPLKTHGTIVDFNYATLMLPAVIIGSTIGSIINLILPMYVVTLGLTLLLFAIFIATFVKLIMTFKKEQKDRS